MKADARPDSGDGPEREELREMLRRWRVPGAPPEVEEGLRLAFRARRAPRRSVLWLSLAACVTLLVAWQLWPGEAPVRRGAAPEPVVAPASQPSADLAVDRDPPSGSTHVVVTRARTHRPATTPRPEPEVIVEPAQAELLAQLGRELWETRQAAPGATIPQMPDVEVLPYREEWEAVAGEWPLVQQSVPIGER